MKNILLVLLVLISFSCKDDENNTPTVPIDDDFEPIPTSLIKEGVMTGVGHTASGTVKIYVDSGKMVVVLDPFSSQNGPDLKVYLSQDLTASEYINLGALKSTSGKQSYDVPGLSALGDYKFVLIWCEQFTVLFGKAELNIEPDATTILKQGEIVGVGHTVSGTVKIYDDAGKKIMVLDPFSSQNGPDLKVYLSKDIGASEYINLGPLKSTTGKQSYDVTGMPDLDQYKYVLVWCQQFSVLFGKAELM